jgi:hypothetical protein
MNTDQTSRERSRAFEAFSRIYDVHRAALQVFALVPSLPDAESLLETQIRLAQMRAGNLGTDVSQSASQLLAAVTAERERGLETMRRLTLVSVCGALEYLVKAVLVDQAAIDPDAASSLLTKAKVKLNASEVLGLTSLEQWFVIADRLYEQLAEPYPLTHERSVRMLTEFAPFPLGEDQKAHVVKALTKDQIRCFNEAFLVRNCLVHNGGKVNSPLARFARKQRGDLIVLDSKYGTPLLNSIGKFATTINEIWLGSL